MARSASRSTSSGVPSRSEDSAMPMDDVTKTSRPSKISGLASSASILRASDSPVSPGGHPPRPPRVAPAREENPELVAAQPRHRVPRTEGGAEPIAHLHEELIT